ncbi:MAG: hypothetical protein U1C55_01670 [Smithellaceae bacterium]|nr:hypothetical protein [Smithellaceae bacterium]
MKKPGLINKRISAARPRYALSITIAAAAVAIMIAAYFTAQFRSYLPMPPGWETVLAWLTPLYIVTQLLRAIGGTIFGMFGVQFWAVAGAPLTEISLLVALLLYFWRQKSRAVVFVMLFCLGFSIINFAYYTADTKLGAITVIGGMSECAGGEHGWGYMIGALGLADYSFGIGKLLFFTGSWLMSFAPLAGLGALAEYLFYVGFFTRQTRREQFDGMISIARNQKIHKQFDEAIITLEKILGKDPDYPEVLFIKAQIYWEAWGDSHTAMKCLKRVIELVPDSNDPLPRWASSLLEELSDKDKARTVEKLGATVTEIADTFNEIQERPVKIQLHLGANCKTHGKDGHDFARPSERR